VLLLPALAGAAPWAHTLTGTLTGTQTQLSHWTAGGKDALAWTAEFKGKLEYEDDDERWVTPYRVVLGGARQEGGAYAKTEDRLEGETTITWKLSRYLNPFLSARVRTQVLPGKKAGATVSAFLDPAYLNQSAGVGWQPYPVFQTRLGIAQRQIVTAEYDQWSGGKALQWDGGVESVSELTWRTEKGVELEGRLEAFVPLNDPDRRTWRSEGALAVLPWKHLTVRLRLQAVNDPSAYDGWQWRQATTVGVRYDF